MKTIIKLSLLLALLLPATAKAYDFEVDGIYYEKSSNFRIGVTSGDRLYSGDVTIPESVTYDSITYSVKYIESNAFKNCSGLTNVTIII